MINDRPLLPRTVVLNRTRLHFSRMPETVLPGPMKQGGQSKENSTKSLVTRWLRALIPISLVASGACYAASHPLGSAMERLKHIFQGSHSPVKPITADSVSPFSHSKNSDGNFIKWLGAAGFLGVSAGLVKKALTPVRLPQRLAALNGDGDWWTRFRLWLWF